MMKYQLGLMIEETCKKSDYNFHTLYVSLITNFIYQWPLAPNKVSMCTLNSFSSNYRYVENLVPLVRIIGSVLDDTINQ